VEVERLDDGCGDLVFGGAAGAGERFFDAGGRELEERDACGGESFEDDAARVGHGERGGGVCSMGEDGLDGGAVGGGAGQQSVDVLGEFDQPGAPGGVAAGDGGAEVEVSGFDEARRAAGGVRFEAGVAGDGKAGIEGDEAHGGKSNEGGWVVGAGLRESDGGGPRQDRRVETWSGGAWSEGSACSRTLTLRGSVASLSCAAASGSRRFHFTLYTGASPPMLRSPLHSYHLEHNAKMIDFAGWEMPISYAWPGGGGGITAEHLHCRSSVGLFDVSHMGRVYFKGRHARRLVERLVTRRVSDMQQGQCRYALCLNEGGGVKDDVLVYRLDDDHFLLVVNAANRLKLLNHFESVKAAGDLTCSIEDKTEKTAMMAMQGPKAMDFISKMSSEVPTLKRYRFVEKNILVLKLIVSRTGYTGEDGVEVIVPAAAIGLAMKMFEKEAKGAEELMKPCGLGARDTLRLEAGMALYGHELTEETNALETGLGFAMNLDKADDERGEAFVGMEALAKTQADGGPRRTLVGLVLDSRRTARQGMPVKSGDATVGEITSGCSSPTLNQSIAMAYVDKEFGEVGTGLAVDLGKGRVAEAKVTAMPFYKRGK